MSASLLAALESTCFGTAAWSEQQVSGALSRAGAIWVLVPEGGYVLGEVVADEVELHRIGVLPSRRNCGMGRSLFRQFSAQAAAAGATRLFLEVREDNRPALALYASVGLQPLGRRPRYYSDGCAALVLGATLTPPDPP